MQPMATLIAKLHVFQRKPWNKWMNIVKAKRAMIAALPGMEGWYLRILLSRSQSARVQLAFDPKGIRGPKRGSESDMAA